MLKGTFFEKYSEEDLREQVIGVFRTLIFLDSVETEKKISAVRMLPKAGLVALMKILAKGLSKQHGYFLTLTSRDNRFISHLDNMVLKGGLENRTN